MSHRYVPAMPSATARLVTAATSHVGLLCGMLAVAQLWLLRATAEGSQPLLSILVRATESATGFICSHTNEHALREGWSRGCERDGVEAACKRSSSSSLTLHLD